MERQDFVDAYRELNQQLLKLVESMSAMAELSTLRGGQQTEPELLRASLEVVLRYQDIESAMVYMAEGDLLTLTAHLGWPDLLSPSTAKRSTDNTLVQVHVGEGIIGLAAEAGELQRRPGTVTVPAQNRDPMGGEGSLLAIPLAASGEVLGVFCATHPHEHHFSAEHERSLQIFCQFLGKLILGNRFMHEMEYTVQRRTRELEAALGEARALKTRFEQLAVVDELTELHNRRFFFPEARAALARACRYREPFSLLILDLDRFKQINDRFGHATGDTVLRDVAALLQQQAREADILARFGGEEFVIAMPETDTRGAMVMAERIGRAVKQLRWSALDDSIGTTASIGVAALSDLVNPVERAHEDTQNMLDRLLEFADTALYYCKEQGRDQVRAYADIACSL